MRFSLEKADWRTQLTIAFASMTVIPLLTLGYFLTAYLLPSIVTRENLLVVVFCNVFLSMAGFSILVKNIMALSKFRRYVESIAGGDLNRQSLLHSGPEVASITQSMETIVDKLKQDRERLEAFSHSLGKEVAKRTEELNKDIAERKMTEQALRESNMMLSDALVSLKEMEHRLVQEEKMGALGQMAGSIAHDFNNALMPICGLSEFLLANPDQLDNRVELVATLKDIHTSADHARQAVVRLREFYKSDDDLDLGVVDVSEVLEKSIASMGAQLQKLKQDRNVVIDVRREFGEVPLVSADDSEMREAVKNVMMNAVDAMPEGGVLTCRSRLEGKWVVMEIADTGVGMAPAVQGHCLEPFFSTKIGHGVGIGLSVVYGIIRRHMGNIEIRSEPGKGTTVRLLMPVMPVSGVKSALESNGAEDVHSLKFLVVDDDIWSRNLLSRYLAAIGHTVETADTGAKGVELFGHKDFDIVITDRAMPDMSGDLVAKSVEKSGKMAPVIMLTGFGDIMKDRGEMPEGVVRVLGKPVSLKELKETIAEAIQGRIVSKAKK